MRIPVTSEWPSSVAKRDGSDGKSNTTLVVVSVTAISVIIVLIFLVFVYRNYRAKRRGSKINGSGSSTRSSRFTWRIRPRTSQYSSSLQNNELEQSSRRGSGDREMTTDPERQNTTAGVDRNTSVRSVMTLPAYSPAARENERILAREGERGGIDTVVEYPEGADEEEQRREEEMESLYQIRLARRNEAREREERRQARREARARGDTAALEEIRRRAESAASESLSQTLIVEHQTANRERRVSSVQYGDLGVARHDGTRLRANSSESDNRPLLDSAASIGESSQRSRAMSNRTLNTHYRGPSASSVLSVSTRASDEFEFPQAQRTTSGESGNDDFEVVSLSQSRSRSGSRIPSPGDIPNSAPPTYDEHEGFEEAPPYESPVRTRGPQLPTIERLPSIHVTTEPTPVDERSSQSFRGDR